MAANPAAMASQPTGVGDRETPRNSDFRVPLNSSR
jgi:hypothetical protein